MKFSRVSLAASLATVGVVGVDAALPDKRPNVRGSGVDEMHDFSRILMDSDLDVKGQEVRILLFVKEKETTTMSPLTSCFHSIMAELSRFPYNFKPTLVRLGVYSDVD